MKTRKEMRSPRQTHGKEGDEDESEQGKVTLAEKEEINIPTSSSSSVLLVTVFFFPVLFFNS